MKTENYKTPQMEMVTFWGTAICYVSEKGAGSISEGESVDWNWQNGN